MGAVPQSTQRQGQEGIQTTQLIEFRVRQGCLTGTGPWLGQAPGWAGSMSHLFAGVRHEPGGLGSAV